jgi:hemoglobin
MTSLYERLGGSPGVRALVDAFYDHMDRDPGAAVIRAMHPDLDSARDKLALFLDMWTGGPNDYVEQRGHPRLRARHLPFAIGDVEAVAWLECMNAALAETVTDAALREELSQAFFRVAAHMRNQ